MIWPLYNHLVKREPVFVANIQWQAEHIASDLRFLTSSCSLRKLPCSACNNSLNKLWKLTGLVTHALQHWDINSMQESHIQCAVDDEQSSNHDQYNRQRWGPGSSSNPILQVPSKRVIDAMLRYAIACCDACAYDVALAVVLLSCIG